MKLRQILLRFTLVICLALFDFDLAKASRSSYGESCSKTQKCDRKAWLSCSDGKCDCSKPDEMLFDQEKGKCVTKSGERCKYGVEESGESSLVEITECIQHANCGADGICNCHPEYHEIFNGTCAKSKSFGANCTDENKCSKFEQLDCLEGTCKCKEGYSIYSSEEMQCVGLLNTSCVINKCGNTTECKNGICVCNEDYYEDSGKCVLRKGPLESCSNDSECIHKGLFVLRCFNNVCNCESGTVLAEVQKTNYRNSYNYYKGNFYNNKLEMEGLFTHLCAPIIGKNCPEGYCPGNAYCFVPDHKRLDSDKFQYGTCDCLENYSINPDKTQCGRTHREFCTTYRDCFNGFVCDDGICQCTSPVSQIAKSSSCATLDGGRCSSTTQCVENAFCEFLPDSDNEVGHCKCNDGFVRGIKGTCDIVFGGNCSYSSTINGERHNHMCDRAAGLTCLNQKCSCPDAMSQYSETLRKCFRRAGAVCSEKEPCVDNALCISSHTNVLPVCTCDSRYKESKNLTCVIDN